MRTICCDPVAAASPRKRSGPTASGSVFGFETPTLSGTSSCPKTLSPNAQTEPSESCTTLWSSPHTRRATRSAKGLTSDAGAERSSESDPTGTGSACANESSV
eukprot:805341-Rhodomonas_salina.6